MSRNEPVPIPALLDPDKLTQANIDAAIKRKSPGVYVLGTLDANHVMTVSYVGRSDADLAAKLRRHVGNYPACLRARGHLAPRLSGRMQALP